MWTLLFDQLRRDYRDKILLKLGKLEKPFMKNKELDIIREILLNLRPKRCLEWGSGYSSLVFPDLIDPELWLAIEHEQDWAKEIGEKNKNPHVKVVYVAPEIPGWNNREDWKKDGTYAEFESYINYPQDQAPYDFIMIDGRARVDCLKKASEILNDRGVVVFHDCNRAHYRKHQDLFTYGQYVTDHRTTHGGLWIGSKGKPVEEVLDVKMHLELWRRHSKLAKLFKIKTGA